MVRSQTLNISQCYLNIKKFYERMTLPFSGHAGARGRWVIQAVLRRGQGWGWPWPWPRDGERHCVRRWTHRERGTEGRTQWHGSVSGWLSTVVIRLIQMNSKNILITTPRFLFFVIQFLINYIKSKQIWIEDI